MSSTIGIGQRIESIQRNLRYAARLLFKKCFLTFIAVLAIGIGANMAIFR